jgi:hypothetical protein
MTAKEYIPFNDLNYILINVGRIRSFIEWPALPDWVVSTVDDVKAVSIYGSPTGAPMQHQHPDFWAGIHKVSIETAAELFKHVMAAAALLPADSELAKVAAQAEAVYAAGIDYADTVRSVIRSKNPEISDAVAKKIAGFQQNGLEIARHRKANIRRVQAGMVAEQEKPVIDKTEAFADMLDQALAADPQLQAMRNIFPADTYEKLLTESKFDPALISPEGLGTLVAVYSFTARNGLLTSPTDPMQDALKKVFLPGLDGAVVLAQVIEALENPPYNMPHFGHPSAAIRSATASTLPSLMIAQQAIQIMYPDDDLIAATQRAFNNLRKDIGAEEAIELKSGKHVALMMVAMASTLPKSQKESVMEQAEKIAAVQDDKELQPLLSGDEFGDAVSMLYAQREGSADYNEGIALLQHAMAESQALRVDPRLAGARAATTSATPPSGCPFKL